jgi:hypothetical protein
MPVLGGKAINEPLPNEDDKDEAVHALLSALKQHWLPRTLEYLGLPSLPEAACPSGKMKARARALGSDEGTGQIMTH